MEQTRKEYIESELNKWNEQYVIGFEQEFEIKAMLNMQYQFMITHHDHVKTQGDIIHNINQIKRNLDLKKKVKLSDNEKREYLFVVENAIQKLNMEELFINSSKVENLTSRPLSTKIVTNEFKIHIKVKGDLEGLRGLRADAILKVEDGTRLLMSK